eukprot:6675293-Prymnesium_polylepis.1
MPRAAAGEHPRTPCRRAGCGWRQRVGRAASRAVRAWPRRRHPADGWAEAGRRARPRPGSSCAVRGGGRALDAALLAPARASRAHSCCGRARAPCEGRARLARRQHVR